LFQVKKGKDETEDNRRSKMSPFLKWAFLIDLAATWLEHVLPITHIVLPVTGDHFGQLAVLAILGIIADEIKHLL
jgi:hypothetical protein